MKEGIVALVVRFDSGSPSLVEALSDDQEISIFEVALERGDEDPLSVIHDLRELRSREDEDFANYVEELLEQPFLKREIQEHGLAWLDSRIKIEEFQKTEKEATEVIATYAYEIFCDDTRRREFYLAGPRAKVKIRVFTLPEAQDGGREQANAA